MKINYYKLVEKDQEDMLKIPHNLSFGIFNNPNIDRFINDRNIEFLQKINLPTEVEVDILYDDEDGIRFTFPINQKLMMKYLITEYGE